MDCEVNGPGIGILEMGPVAEAKRQHLNLEG